MDDLDENDEIYDNLDFDQLLLDSKSKLPKQVSFSTVAESALKENEIDLLSDLIAVEEKEKAAKQNRESEFENLKKEIEKLNAIQTLNASKISQLLTENMNLKRNICSLYKTAKSEIDHKDSLLTEANKKIDNFLLQKNVHNCQTDELDRNSNNSRKSLSGRSIIDSNGRRFEQMLSDNVNTSITSDSEPQSGERSSKLSKTDKILAQNLLPDPSIKNVSKESGLKKSTSSTVCSAGFKSNKKNSKDKNKKTMLQNSTSESSKMHVTKRKVSCSVKSDTQPEPEPTAKRTKLAQISETPPPKISKLSCTNVRLQTVPHPESPPAVSNSCSQSRDTTETNNVFFSLLPNHLKQAFIEYEQSQIISLNRLKQSFVNQYFNCDTSVHSPTSTSHQHQLTASFSQILFNKVSQEASSVNTESLLTPSTSKNESDSLKVKRDVTPVSRTPSSRNTRTDSCKSRDVKKYNSSSSQRDRRPFSSRRRSVFHDKRRSVAPRRVL